MISSPGFSSLVLYICVYSFASTKVSWLVALQIANFEKFCEKIEKNGVFSFKINFLCEIFEFLSIHPCVLSIQTERKNMLEKMIRRVPVMKINKYFNAFFISHLGCFFIIILGYKRKNLILEFCWILLVFEVIFRFGGIKWTLKNWQTCCFQT